MICPKVLFLTFLIIGTFAKDAMGNMEERFEALERELAAAKMEDIKTSKRFEVMERKLAACEVEREDIESNKQFKVMKRQFATMKKAFEDLKTTFNTKVIFNAKKTEGNNDVGGFLTFDQVDINIGEGFDGEVFAVPVSGIYKMTFSGTSSFEKKSHTLRTMIFVQKNGANMFCMFDNTSGNATGKNISYTWMMKLVQGDKLKLFSAGSYLYADSLFPLTFTGELIHIEN